MNVENQGKYIERKCTSKSLFAIKRSLLNRSYIPRVFPSCSVLWLLLLTLIVLLSVPIHPGLTAQCLCGCSNICRSKFRILRNIWRGEYACVVHCLWVYNVQLAMEELLIRVVSQHQMLWSFGQGGIVRWRMQVQRELYFQSSELIEGDKQVHSPCWGSGYMVGWQVVVHSTERFWEKKLVHFCWTMLWTLQDYW